MKPTKTDPTPFIAAALAGLSSAFLDRPEDVAKRAVEIGNAAAAALDAELAAESTTTTEPASAA